MPFDLDYKNKIILLEDIDCMGISLDRKITNNNNIANNTGPHKKNTLHQQQNFNLSHFFNLLDGINEMSGRILIITTNYIDKLDSALIRPGRIDLKVQLDFLTRQTLNDMLYYYFNKQIEDEQTQIKNVTASEIIGMIGHGRTFEDICNYVLTCT